MSEWRERLTVPRAAFVPSVIWEDSRVTDGFAPVSEIDDPARWQDMVAAETPVITQVDDGSVGTVALVPSSSCSQPSLVADMLDALDIHEGHRVLEIGAGTGWNAALLSERVGENGQVISIEVDPDVADSARRALDAGGYGPTVITGDGTEGYAPAAPYDRVIATASVRTIPRAWIDQTLAGGVILAPWGTDYGEDALTRLETNEDGSASGRCGMRLAFMRLRNQRRDFLDPTDEELSTADKTVTMHGGLELFEMVDFSRVSYTIGVRVPNCYLTVEDVDDDQRRIELHDVRSRSWANVSLVRGEHPWTVHQLGPRRLWDEVDSAYAWWLDAGRPTPDRYKLTVAPDGTHTVWIDQPDGEIRWPLE